MKCLKIFKNEDFLIFCSIFGIIGIGISIEDKSLLPVFLCLCLAILAYSIFLLVSRISYWRTKRRLDKLTPEQLATLFGDIVNQSKWDPEARDAIHKLCDNFRKKQESPKK